MLDLNIFSILFALYFTFMGDFTWKDKKITNKLIKFLIGLVVGWFISLCILIILILATALAFGIAILL